MENFCYYAGLPSAPILIARSSTRNWEGLIHRGTFSRYRQRRLDPVGDHPFVEIWEDNFAFKIHALLDRNQVEWTSTDVVRIGFVDDDQSTAGPVVLWIGIKPQTLSLREGTLLVSECKNLLEEHGVSDVEVEIRESVVVRNAGPQFSPTPKYCSVDSRSDPKIHEPLRATLGLPISTPAQPDVVGTGGFYITDGENLDKLFLVTARHVVINPEVHNNRPFDAKNHDEHGQEVTLFNDAGFASYLAEVQHRVRVVEHTVDYHARQGRSAKAKEEAEEIKALYQTVSSSWSIPEHRVVGHVYLSPPIDVGPGSNCYTEDWALVEIDTSKIDFGNFRGNAIALGSWSNLIPTIKKLFPDSPDNPPNLDYPLDGLLEIKGTISDEEMRKPPTRDKDGNPCCIVIKSGHATGLTFGRANTVFSYVRNCYHDGSIKISKEWPILQHSESRYFSVMGDSGSVVVDGLGRMGGIITSCAGQIPDPQSDEFPDITYVTPISFLLKRIEDHGLKPNYRPSFKPPPKVS